MIGAYLFLVYLVALAIGVLVLGPRFRAPEPTWRAQWVLYEPQSGPSTCSAIVLEYGVRVVVRGVS